MFFILFYSADDIQSGGVLAVSAADKQIDDDRFIYNIDRLIAQKSKLKHYINIYCAEVLYAVNINESMSAGRHTQQ